MHKIPFCRTEKGKSMRKICFWVGVIVAVIVLAAPIFVLPNEVAALLTDVSLIVAANTAQYVNEWLKSRIKDVKHQEEYEKVFIFIGRVFICLIAAVITAIGVFLVAVLFFNLLFDSIIMPILSLIS